MATVRRYRPVFPLIKLRNFVSIGVCRRVGRGWGIKTCDRLDSRVKNASIADGRRSVADRVRTEGRRKKEEGRSAPLKPIAKVLITVKQLNS